MVILTPAIARADVVETADGARLTGTVTFIGDRQIVLDTAYAGELTIELDQVTSIQTDAPINVRLADGSVQTGPLQPALDQQVQVSGESGTLTAPVTDIQDAWEPGTRDPALPEPRKWKFLASLNLLSKEGNTDEAEFGFDIEARLDGPNDLLLFYAGFDYSETNDRRTEEEYIFGGRYENYFTEKIGWYARGDFEKDDFEALDLRSTVAGGLTYRFFATDRHDLTGRAGISYRYEAFQDAEDQDNIGADIGLSQRWQFADWAELRNELTYTPSFEDFGSYRFVQDSSVRFPLGTSDKWNLGLGLKNEYNSEPVGEKEELDTTYYARLMLRWE